MGYLVLLICLVSGIMDEGLSTKTQIFGDGYYQSWLFRFSSDASQVVCLCARVQARARVLSMHEYIQKHTILHTCTYVQVCISIYRNIQSYIHTCIHTFIHIQRAKFQPKYDEVTGEKVGLTTQTINGRNMLSSRAPAEISACLDDEVTRAVHFSDNSCRFEYALY